MAVLRGGEGGSLKVPGLQAHLDLFTLLLPPRQVPLFKLKEAMCDYFSHPGQSLKFIITNIVRSSKLKFPRDDS